MIHVGQNIIGITMNGMSDMVSSMDILQYQLVCTENTHLGTIPPGHIVTDLDHHLACGQKMTQRK